MRVLVTSFLIQSGSGAELYLRDLCIGLKDRGIDVGCYGLRLGKLAEELRSLDIQVTSQLSDLKWMPDIIHGHHNLTTIAAICHFENAKGIFLCHDAKAWHDKAVDHPRIRHFCAVDRLCQNRVQTDLNKSTSNIPIIGNGVRLNSFPQRPSPLPEDPKKALVFSNYAAEHNYLPIVRDACKKRNIQLTTIGHGSGNFLNQPQNELFKYDLVFAKARCAMEVMASGCSVILCDAEGLGQIVTVENFQELRSWNFGRATLNQEITEIAISRQIQRYDPEEAYRVSQVAREKLDWEKVLDKWIELYENTIQEPAPTTNIEHSKVGPVEGLINALSGPLFSLYEKNSIIDQLQAENRRISNRSILKRIKNFVKGRLK